MLLYYKPPNFSRDFCAQEMWRESVSHQLMTAATEICWKNKRSSIFTGSSQTTATVLEPATMSFNFQIYEIKRQNQNSFQIHLVFQGKQKEI